MADLTAILSGLGKLALQVAPQITGVGPALGLGQAIVSAIGVLKPHHPGPLPPEVEQGEAGLIEKVTAHADRTFDRAEQGD
jgi:hypothetical protein